MEHLLPDLVRITAAAGEAILQVYSSDFAVQTKSDESPLTQADLASHRVIVEGLAEIAPEIPVLSEESVPPEYAVRSQWDRYWLVDPLDGTKEFVNRNGEFTVNIALIEGQRARLGVVGVPTQNIVYTGDAERFGEVARTPVGSSLKLCILAEGRADIYPRLGPTSEWDIAAAHAVLSAAGGDVWAAGGASITYNAKESFLNPEFIAVADASFDWKGSLPDVPPKE